jgi:hypothetical protein
MSAPARSLARDIVTPVTMVLFIVSGLTGVMLLLHWQSALVKSTHEWLGLVFAAMALWHLARHWKPFRSYLRRRVPQVALALSLVVAVGFTAMTGQSGGGLAPGALYHRLSEAPVAAAAPALGVETTAALVRLEDAGITVDATDTLAEIADRAGLSAPAVLGLIAGGQP